MRSLGTKLLVRGLEPARTSPHSVVSRQPTERLRPFRALLLSDSPASLRTPPQTAHSLGVAAFAPFEHITWLRSVRPSARPLEDPRLARTIMGLEFPSPIGLAGGFDKEGKRPRALAALGFGFVELGTVTARPQEANPSPNLFRLPLDHAIINRLGFPDHGAAALAQRVAQIRHSAWNDIGVPVGISIGKSRAVTLDPIEDAIADYLESFELVRPVADFVVVNVSSPNTKGLRALQTGAIARSLLSAIARANGNSTNQNAKRVPLLIENCS